MKNPSYYQLTTLTRSCVRICLLLHIKHKVRITYMIYATYIHMDEAQNVVIALTILL